MSSTAHREQATAPLRLGFLVKVWPKLSETFILEEVLGLERQGVNLHLYTLAPPSDAIRHQEVAQVRAPVSAVPSRAWSQAGAHALAHAWCAGRRPLAWLRTLAQALRRGGPGLRAFAQAPWLARALHRQGIEHLHVHFISQTTDVAELSCHLIGLPFSVSAHAKDIYTGRPEDLRRKLRAARFTVTCTEFNRQTLAALAPDAAVHRMYHGIDHRLFHPGRRRLAAADRPVQLLAVGRLREKKGHRVLIAACALLRDRGWDFRCDIVGYGEQQSALEDQIRSLGLPGQVQLRGKLAREAVLDAYALADVFVQPSVITDDGDRDGIPNVLLEAMSMGVPVVASRVSGIPELVVDGHNGCLVEPGDPAALAQAIETVLAHADAARSMSQRGRASVLAAFDNDRNLQLLRGLLADHPCGAHDCAALEHRSHAH